MHPGEMLYWWFLVVAWSVTAIFLTQTMLECCVRAFVRGYLDERSKFIKAHYERQADGK